MTEIDFSRDNVPHLRGKPPARRVSEIDTFNRETLLPLLGILTPEQRNKFDEQTTAHYAPDAPIKNRRAAQEVLHRLSLEDLMQVADVVVDYIASQTPPSSATLK